MRIIPVFIVASFVTASAFAQTADTQDKPGLSDAQRAEISAGALARHTNPGHDSLLRVAPVFSLESSTKDKIATASFGVQLTDLTVSVGISAPLDGDTGIATFADLDGLRKKSTGAFSLLWSHWTIADPATVLNAACEKYAADSGKKVEDLPSCSILALKRDNTPAGREAMKILRQVDPGTVFYAGGGAKIAPERFTYFTESDLATSVGENHTSWSANAVAGVLLRSGVLIAGEYNRQVAFSGAKKTNVCSPFGTQGALKCSDKTLGAPGDPDRSHQLTLEVRKFFTQSFAVSPKWTYDATKSAHGIEIPLYFIKGSEGGLTGGVTIGYRSDTKEVTASAFVGSILGLITRAGG